MSTTARSRGCRCRCWPAPVSPRPSPMLLRESREKPGPPTAPSTLFPSVDSKKGLPGRAGEPPLTGGDRVSGTLCARVQRGARPREQGRGRGSGAGAPGREHESAQRPRLALLPWARAGVPGSAGPCSGRGFSLPLLPGLSNLQNSLPPPATPRFQTRTICVTPILNLRQTCIAWL